MKIPKKLRNLVIGGLIALNSVIPLKAVADAKNTSILNTPIFMNYDKTYQDNKLDLSLTDKYDESIGIREVIKKAPETIALWCLADSIRVAMHEQGHYDKATELGSNASIDYGFGLNHDGLTLYKEKLDKKDAAKFNIAGLIRTGELAERLKQDIILGDNSKGNLKFPSVLALSAELNFPLYIIQHYTEQINNKENSYNDITNFSRNSGIKPEQIAISSGLHLLLNSPYLYGLVKNVISPNPENLGNKDYYFSFRFDGDRYTLSLHANPDFIEEKISKLNIDFAHSLGKN